MWIHLKKHGAFYFEIKFLCSSFCFQIPLTTPICNYLLVMITVTPISAAWRWQMHPLKRQQPLCQHVMFLWCLLSPFYLCVFICCMEGHWYNSINMQRAQRWIYLFKWGGTFAARSPSQKDWQGDVEYCIMKPFFMLLFVLLW